MAVFTSTILQFSQILMFNNFRMRPNNHPMGSFQWDLTLALKCIEFKIQHFTTTGQIL